jgi:hypothetical protein
VPAYDEDVFAWACEQMQFLREGRVDLLDIEHLTDELKKVAHSVVHEHVNAIVQLLVHLFKWQYLPTERTDGLRAMIEAGRSVVLEALEKSPSLSHTTDAPDQYQMVWDIAISRITTESQREYFPDECPWAFDDVLSRGWLPTVDESGPVVEPLFLVG